MKAELRNVKHDTLPLGLLQSLPDWEALNASARKAIESRTAALNDASETVINSRLLWAERWAALYQVLDENRMFSAFCELYGINRSSALNYVAGHKNALSVLPEPVFRQAAIRGKNMLGYKDDAPLGKYTEAVKRLPPPKTADTTVIVQWLQDVEDLRKKMRKKAAAQEPNVNVLLKGSYRSLVNVIEKVPPRRKRGFLERLVGMMLTRIGVSQAQQFHPEGIPDGFQAVVGRPSAAA